MQKRDILRWRDQLSEEEEFAISVTETFKGGFFERILEISDESCEEAKQMATYVDGRYLLLVHDGVYKVTLSGGVDLVMPSSIEREIRFGKIAPIIDKTRTGFIGR